MQNNFERAPQEQPEHPPEENIFRFGTHPLTPEEEAAYRQQAVEKGDDPEILLAYIKSVIEKARKLRAARESDEAIEAAEKELEESAGQ